MSNYNFSTLKEILKIKHEIDPVLVAIDYGISLTSGFCLRCEFRNPPEILMKWKVPEGLIGLYNDLLERREKSGSRKMTPAISGDDRWAVFCSECLEKASNYKHIPKN